MSSSESAAPGRRNRRDLLLLGALCVAPVVASYALYYGWRPGAAKNYGELIPPAPVAGIAEPLPGAPPELAALKGKWVLVSVDSAACEASCKQKLWQMRQLRLTQGKDAERVARAWVIDDGGTPAADLAQEYEGTVWLKAAEAKGLARLPAPASPRDHLYLVDPLGNLMMRFPKDADPNRIKKDLTHLLKVSRIG